MYGRILFSVLLMAASVLWMAAASASATILVGSKGSIYTGNVAAASEGHVVLDNPIAKVECASTMEAAVESHGEGVTVKGNVSALAFSGCTNSWHATVVAAGSLEVHSIGSSDGTLTSSGATAEVTRFGITCRYATNSTDIGTFTGGSPATIDISANIAFHSGSFLCGSSGTSWTGSYEVTSPSALFVDQGAAEPSPEAVSPDEFEENKAAIAVKVEDTVGELFPYTVISVTVVNKGGNWGLEEAGNCENKGVAAKGPICEVKVKCGPGPGKAEISITAGWGNPPEFLDKRTPVVCK